MIFFSQVGWFPDHRPKAQSKGNLATVFFNVWCGIHVIIWGNGVSRYSAEVHGALLNKITPYSGLGSDPTMILYLHMGLGSGCG